MTVGLLLASGALLLAALIGLVSGWVPRPTSITPTIAVVIFVGLLMAALVVGGFAYESSSQSSASSTTSAPATNGPSTPSMPPERSATSPTPTQPPTTRSLPPIHPVTIYNNYGSTTNGIPMCRGNPQRPESMPGGTVSQSFIIPAGVAEIDRAVVDIDPDSTVTAHARLLVNGDERATSSAEAAGDTQFEFARSWSALVRR